MWGGTPWPLASSLSLSITSPRSNAPKASWQENLANEFPAVQSGPERSRAQHSTGRVGNGPDSKQANDWQRLPAYLWKSPEMQRLLAHLVIQTVYVQKASKGTYPARFDFMPRVPSHSRLEVLSSNKNQACLANGCAFQTAHLPVPPTGHRTTLQSSRARRPHPVQPPLPVLARISGCPISHEQPDIHHGARRMGSLDRGLFDEEINRY